MLRIDGDGSVQERIKTFDPQARIPLHPLKLLLLRGIEFVGGSENGFLFCFSAVRSGGDVGTPLTGAVNHTIKVRNQPVWSSPGDLNHASFVDLTASSTQFSYLDGA